jgi:cell division protein FtsA
MAIDIGKDQTSFVLYEDSEPVRHETIPIGGDAVTRDISIGMQIDLHEAERIKIQYGDISAQAPEKIPKNETLDQHFLHQIIRARYEEIIETIQHKLEWLEKDGRLA